MLAVDIIPAGVSNPWLFLTLGSVAVAMVGIGKAGFGGGAGLAAVPLLIYACGGRSTLAVALLLPLLIAIDYVSMFFWWRQWKTKPVMMLMPGLLLGIALGGVILGYFISLGKTGGDETTNALLNMTIGIIAFIFVAVRGIQAWRGALGTFRPVWWQGFIAGGAAGATSTIAHGAGPIITMFFLPQDMNKGQFVATTVLWAFIGNQLKLIPYAYLDMLSVPNLLTCLAFVPAVLAGVALGKFLHSRVSDWWFSMIVHGVLGIISIHLIVTSIKTLM